jgi:hypothetical protein
MRDILVICHSSILSKEGIIKLEFNFKLTIPQPFLYKDLNELIVKQMKTIMKSNGVKDIDNFDFFIDNIIDLSSMGIINNVINTQVSSEKENG